MTSRRKKVGLLEKYNRLGGPRPGQKGYRDAPWGGDLLTWTSTMLMSVLSSYEEPEFFWAWRSALGLEPYEDWALLDFVPTPPIGRHGRVLEPRPQEEARRKLALYATNVALQTTDRWDTSLGDFGQLPFFIARHVLLDGMMHGKGKPRLVTIDKDTARAFVAKYHRHLPKLNPKGLMFALGVMVDGDLVAVATAGSPTGRWAKPYNTLELTRIASDGSTLGAASMLAARLLDLLPQSRRRPEDKTQPTLYVTYSFLDEAGTTYKALRDKGLRPVGYTPPTTPGGRRPGGSQGGMVGKIRWEAGVDALPPTWGVLKPAVRKALASTKAVQKAWEYPRDRDDPVALPATPAQRKAHKARKK